LWHDRLIKIILNNLFKLQDLEIENDIAVAPQITELRAGIPENMLRKYDRMRANGKKGIALVRNHVCTNCRIQVPIAVTASLMNGAESQVCGNCGRFLCLPDPSEVRVEEVAAAPVTKPKKRRVKAVAKV
jgi:predicted  nucleic acid-binding Zn-ribbon protein